VFKIGVLQFERNAIPGSQADLITNLLAGEIAVSSAFKVDSLPDTTGPVGVEAAVKACLETGLDYIALWSLRDVSEIEPISRADIEIADASSDALVAGVSSNLSGIASATLDVRLVDAAASAVSAGLSETGGSSPAVSPLAVPEREAMEAEFGEFKARAVVSAVSLAGRALRGLVGGNDPLVTGVKGEEYTLSVGTASGAKAGALYAVLSDWPWEKIPIALLRLREVGNISSVAVPARPVTAAAVKPGDRLEALSGDAARNIMLASDREPRREDELPGEAEAAVSSGDAVPGEGNDGKDIVEILAERAESSGGVIISGEISSKNALRSFEGASAASSDFRAGGATDSASGQGWASDEYHSAQSPAEIRVAAVDRDTSTGLDVIETYPLPPIARSNLRAGQTNARNLYERGQYAESLAMFKQLAESYRGNYLSAYWAGMASLRLDRKKDALAWFDRALAVNPNYRPALEAKGLAER
jgi:hypothetical protein